MRSSALRKLLASAMLLLSVPALAASQKDVDDCRQPLEDDRRIAGCTNVIDDGSTSPRLRSIAFNNRAIALRHKGQYDQAIQDHNEAIKLTPDFAAAYNSRAIVHSVKGENDLALQDYNEAIRLNPDRCHCLAKSWRDLSRQGPIRSGHSGLRRSHQAQPEFCHCPERTLLHECH